MQISTGHIPQPNRSVRQLVDGLRARIRGQSLEGRDLVFSAAAIREELGADNKTLVAALGYHS
jgi:hypothetical protein